MVPPGSTMQSEESGPGDLEVQLATKEREWKELQAARVHQLETSLKEAQEECLSLRERHQLLRKDFLFNLDILEERDRELEKYDAVTARALTVEHNRQEELKHLRLQITRLEEQRARDSEETQQEVTRSRLQLDQLQRSTAAEIQKQMEEHERMKCDLQSRIQEVETQRQETAAACDRELRQREHEFNLKMDKMRAVVLSCELKVQLLSSETEIHIQAKHQAEDALRTNEEFTHKIQTLLQHKEHEITHLTAAKDHKIKELEDKLKWMETQRGKEKDEHIKKLKEVVQSLKKCDVQLEVQCQDHTQRLLKAEQHIVKLQGNVKTLAARLRCMRKAMGQKDETIRRLRKEVEDTKNTVDKYTSQVTMEMVVKDTEIITLKERESKLRSEQERSREEVERYKQQLSAGLKRELALEQMQVQVELEWQSRCEDMKAQHYLANEVLIQDLTRAKDQAKAELKEKEQELQNVTVLLRSVQTERDQAVQGLTPKADSLASEDIRCLQQQNGVLRAVVNQMRKEMEDLIHQQPSTPQTDQPPGPSAGPSAPHTANTQTTTGPPLQPTHISSTVNPADYLDQLSQLKARCRRLEEQLERSVGLSSKDPSTDQNTQHVAPSGPENIPRQNQEQGCPHTETHTNTSALAKQEIRVEHLESVITNLTKQSALVQQLQEENLYLRRRQASGLIPAALLDTKSHQPVLRGRLKQAVSCIARLSREKQQLIEMGNRLRAQITSTGLQGPSDGGPRPTSSSVVLTEPVEPERDQHDQLLALEQLQYRLTTQELQYALRQRTCSTDGQIQSGTDNRQGPDTDGASNPTSQGHNTTDRPEDAEKRISQSQSSIDVGLNSSLSRSQQSLQELWEILDHGFSPSLFSEVEGELSHRAVSGPGGVHMTVLQNQTPTQVQQGRKSSIPPSNKTKTSRPGPTTRTCKIRNYNVKD